MVLKRPVTSSAARLITDIDASFNIFFQAKWTWIGKMIAKILPFNPACTAWGIQGGRKRLQAACPARWPPQKQAVSGVARLQGVEGSPWIPLACF
jgi:hypothetical protein